MFNHWKTSDGRNYCICVECSLLSLSICLSLVHQLGSVVISCCFIRRVCHQVDFVQFGDSSPFFYDQDKSGLTARDVKDEHRIIPWVFIQQMWCHAWEVSGILQEWYWLTYLHQCRCLSCVIMWCHKLEKKLLGARENALEHVKCSWYDVKIQLFTVIQKCVIIEFLHQLHSFDPKWGNSIWVEVGTFK